MFVLAPRFITAAVITGATCSALAAVPAAFASPTPLRVTIGTAPGFIKYVWGEVHSPERSCVNHPNVVVFKQRGARGGGDDLRMGTANTYRPGRPSGAQIWNTAWYFIMPKDTKGKFYVTVRKSNQCKGETSRTVHYVWPA